MRGSIAKRILSFPIVILIAASILASVALNAWTASVGSLSGAPGWVIEVLSFVVSFLLLFVLFAIIFKYFPDAEVAWSDVKAGTLVSAAEWTVHRDTRKATYHRDQPVEASLHDEKTIRLVKNGGPRLVQERIRTERRHVPVAIRRRPKHRQFSSDPGQSQDQGLRA
jgi:hypothetical protein